MKVEQGWCGQIVDRVLLLQEHGGMREEGKKFTAILLGFRKLFEIFLPATRSKKRRVHRQVISG